MWNVKYHHARDTTVSMLKNMKCRTSSRIASGKDSTDEMNAAWNATRMWFAITQPFSSAWGGRDGGPREEMLEKPRCESTMARWTKAASSEDFAAPSWSSRSVNAA